jgi:hypothetical protein
LRSNNPISCFSGKVFHAASFVSAAKRQPEFDRKIWGQKNAKKSRDSRIPVFHFSVPKFFCLVLFFCQLRALVAAPLRWVFCAFSPQRPFPRLCR